MNSQSTETFPIPILTVDVALFTIRNNALHLGTLVRPAPPHQGRRALIGGYVHADKDASLEGSAARILRDKAGLTGIYIEQLRTFGGPQRDPRGWSASVAYYALAPESALAQSPKSAELVWTPTPPADEQSHRGLPQDAQKPHRGAPQDQLPFDHEEIVAVAIARLRDKASYSSLPMFLLPEHFTFPELKSVYETVIGAPLNDSAFRRKITEMKIIEEVDEKSPATSARKRPAQLYRRASATLSAFDRTL
jgi:8-oxo-dGTP diphosphatase